jgi:hypothetical protein
MAAVKVLVDHMAFALLYTQQAWPFRLLAKHTFMHSPCSNFSHNSQAHLCCVHCEAISCVAAVIWPCWALIQHVHLLACKT